tara:strand:- start:216 stop:839 length:624 start_codon:yes stop_codon:yes gene_type:complete
MKLDKLDNIQWCDILTQFFETYFKELPINIREDNDKGIYINTIYSDISQSIINTFKEELDIYHYSYNTKYGIEGIHIKNLPTKVILNDEVKCKCINKFTRKFTEIRNIIHLNYMKYFNSSPFHNLYKCYLLNKKKKINYTYLYNYITEIKDINTFHSQMKEYNLKYKLLICILNYQNINYCQAYDNREKIRTLERYFHNFWKNKLNQ